MKPPPFSYADPDSIDGAVELLAQYGEDAKVLAGGQSLVPLLNMRLAQPEVLIDINRVPELSFIQPRERHGVPGLAIGAATRQRVVEDGGFPLLREALACVGHPQIRNRGTVGGSIAHADPAAELPLLFRVLDAVATVRSIRGSREAEAADFFLHTFTTALAADELLTEVWFPLPGPHTGQAFLEVARRHGDFALVAAAATITLDDDGSVADCQIAVGGAAPVPARAPTAEAALRGRLPSLAALEKAGALTAKDMDPTGDVHADAAYRRDVAGTLITRALSIAWERVPRDDA